MTSQISTAPARAYAVPNPYKVKCIVFRSSARLNILSFKKIRSATVAEIGDARHGGFGGKIKSETLHIDFPAVYETYGGELDDTGVFRMQFIILNLLNVPL